MTVVWTVEARRCLVRIRAHIAKDSPKAAFSMTERLIERARQLEVAPESGRRVPEYPLEDLREVLERPYRIIYEQQDERIAILSVMHYRRLLPDRSSDLESGSA